MKLVYFYIQSHGCLHDRGFLLDARYSVMMARDDSGIKILIKKTEDKLDNILYGNVSFTAIVGDNGAGKSTFLDALQAWLVDFENNPGFVILEDRGELFYLSATECKLKIDKSGMKMKKYKGKELPLPLNVVFYSDVFQSKAEIHEISKNSKGRNVRFYRDISTGGVINALSKEMRRYPFMREFQMNDSLLQIQLVEHFSTNRNEYPWKGVIGEKNLNFQAINIRYISQRIGLRNAYSRFHNAAIPIKIFRSIDRAERYCHAKDIIRETLFFDYIDWIYSLARDVHSSSFLKETGQEYSLTIVLSIINILFSEYWDENNEYSFLKNLFCGFNQENNENNENKIKEKLGLENLEIPSFEVYVSLCYQLIENMPWIVEGIEENQIFISNFYRLIRPMDRTVSIAIPKGELVKDLYSEYMDAHTYNDFLKFTWHMSSGENSICLLFARLYDVIESIHINDAKEKSYLIMIDEIDNLYHPKWQQKIVNWIAQFLNNKFPWYQFQVIITTHSPVLLSDIPENRVIFMPKDEVYENEIQRIIIRRYVIPQTPKDIIYNQDVLCVKMSGILERRYSSNYIYEMSINEKNAAEIVSQLIDIVGEDIWREQLRVMYNKYFTLGNPEEVAAYKIRKLLSRFSPQQKEKILKEFRDNDSNN